MLSVVVRYLEEFAWIIGIGYCADRDAAPYILPIVDRNDNDIPDHLEHDDDPVCVNAYPDRWDGVNGSPDYTVWQYATDGVVWAAKDYRIDMKYEYAPDGRILPTTGNSKRRRSYMKVRPLVCSGLSNTQIVQATGMGMSSVDRYASDVRRALKMRYDIDNPTPTLSGGGGAETHVFT